MCVVQILLPLSKALTPTGTKALLPDDRKPTISNTIGMLKKLTICGGVQVRGQAMKSLSLVIEAQPELLGRASISTCLHDALFSDKEDSAHVRSPCSYCCRLLAAGESGPRP